MGYGFLVLPKKRLLFWLLDFQEGTSSKCDTHLLKMLM